MRMRNVQTVAEDLFRRRELVPSISRAVVKLNVLNYKKARKNDSECRSNSVSVMLRQVACLKISTVEI